jgi:poly-gamma-glutamate synthesis protein (capsule biosynthesis protein)
MFNITDDGDIFVSEAASDQTASVLIGGDVFLHGKQLAEVTAGRTREMLADVIHEIDSCDFSIVNLEAPFTESADKILKSGPNIKMPPSAVEFLKSAKIDAVTLANNHIGDYAPQGVLDTIRVLDNNDIKYVGAGNNIAVANMPLQWTVNGISMAIVSIAENEFGVAEKSTPGMAAFDIIENIKLIERLSSEIDVVIVIPHGGIEHYPLPRPGLVKLYRAFADAGASAVVAHHPHCSQGMEIWNDVPIVYSLGNFVFPSRNPAMLTPDSLWHTGYMVKIEFSKARAAKLKLIPYSQFADGQSWYALKGSQLEDFFKYYTELSGIIADENKIKRYFDAWTFLNQERLTEWLNWQISADDNFPMLHVKNEFWCESHCELAKNILMLMQKNELSNANECVPELKNLLKNIWLRKS